MNKTLTWMEMNRNEFNAKLVEMTVKELRELVKILGFEIKGAWKMVKADLAKEIFFAWEKEAEAKAKETEAPKKKASKRISRKNRIIVIFNELGEEAYRFDTIKKALEALEIYREKDLKFICNKGEVREYSAKSKYYKFNGYRFTFEDASK